MKIIFSTHAILKLGQRNISKQLVIEAVHFPDFLKPTYHFREERYKRFGKNWLKVVAIQEGNTLTVITVHWVAKVKNV